MEIQKSDYPPFETGDIVITNFYMRDNKISRTVRKCEPCGYSESGWMVATDSSQGGLYADANWFKKAKTD